MFGGDDHADRTPRGACGAVMRQLLCSVRAASARGELGSGIATKLAHVPVNQAAPLDAPVIEVALGVAFDPLPELGPVALARLAGDWQAEYPEMREVPGHPPDRLDPGMSIQFGTGALPSRLWLLSKDENDLLQIQNDTLLVNWRRMRDEDVYPGHAALLERFGRLWGEFERKVNRKSLRPRLVEWTYVDRLDSGVLGEGGLTFVDWSLGSQLPGIERGFNFQMVRELRHAGKREGYLSVTGSPASAPVSGSFYALNISTKLNAAGMAPSLVSGRLKEAHDVSYTAFTAVVDPKLQGGRSRQ